MRFFHIYIVSRFPDYHISAPKSIHPASTSYTSHSNRTQSASAPRTELRVLATRRSIMNNPQPTHRQSSHGGRFGEWSVTHREVTSDLQYSRRHGLIEPGSENVWSGLSTPYSEEQQEEGFFQERGVRIESVPHNESRHVMSHEERRATTQAAPGQSISVNVPYSNSMYMPPDTSTRIVTGTTVPDRRP